MNLDNVQDFNSALQAAVALGISHAGQGSRRLKADEVMNYLGHRFNTKFGYRNFHREILNRGYGLAFVNRAKRKMVLKASNITP